MSAALILDNFSNVFGNRRGLSSSQTRRRDSEFRRETTQAKERSETDLFGPNAQDVIGLLDEFPSLAAACDATTGAPVCCYVAEDTTSDPVIVAEEAAKSAGRWSQAQAAHRYGRAAVMLFHQERPDESPRRDHLLWAVSGAALGLATADLITPEVLDDLTRGYNDFKERALRPLPTLSHIQVGGVMPGAASKKPWYKIGWLRR